MNLLELVDKRDKKVEELKELTSILKVEKREMNKNEQDRFNNIKSEVESFNKQINDIKEADERASVVEQKNNENKMDTNFSLLKTIRSLVSNKIDDETSAILAEGRRNLKEAGINDNIAYAIPFEYRDLVSGTATSGQEVVTEEKMPLLVALKAKTILGQLGATFYTGVKGDISIPTYAGTTCYWADEVDSTTGGTGATAEITLAPKRLTAEVAISKTLLAQDSINFDAQIRQEIINAILVKLENTVFDATAGSTKRPAGLFYGADYSGTLSGATSWVKLVGMKGEVDASNALNGSLAYVTTPSLSAKFETTVKESGAAVYCMENGKIAGYPVYSTSNVNDGKIAFGNWADYVVANWGDSIAIEAVNDPKNNKVILYVNTYWDFKVRRSASFKLNQLS